MARGTSATRSLESAEASPHPINRLLVGGKLVGNRPKPLPNHRFDGAHGTFEPIITPEVTHNNRKKAERYVLLPQARFVSVLSYKTGVKVATLVPSTKEDDEDVLIECVSLVKYPRTISEKTVQDVLDTMDTEGDGVQQTKDVVEETLVMVGCQDGSLREFSLQALSASNGQVKADLGAYSIEGPCHFPRRVIRVLKKDPIMHLAIPHLPSHQVRKDGILVYVAARSLQHHQQDNLRNGSTFYIEVLRVLVPHFDGATKDVKISSNSMRSIHKFKSKILVSKKRNAINTLPFRMMSVATPISNTNDSKPLDMSVFVVLARPNAISIYYDQLDSIKSFQPLLISMPSNNPLTALEISLNKADITCGHQRGNICVINNILKDVEQYQIATRKEKELNKETKSSLKSILPPDPRKNMITTRVHWHALPVSTLVYDSTSYAMDPLLYSGGEESVLVTWQISRGKDRPVQVHPRIALGGIVHLVSCDRCDDNPASGMLVYCEDNSLQLLESHNKGRLWKIQGLACSDNENSLVSLGKDPRSSGQKNSQLVLTGLKKAPGYMHWFDPMRERLASSLEVAPFNRISRNEPEERPLPTPSIIGHVFSKDGQDLITIDESPTENTSVGANYEAKQGGKHGAVGTIRFWSWNDSSTARGETSPPYDEIASMTFPHGPKNRISAIAMSQDGSIACTLSCNEKCYRVWQKSRALSKRGVSANNNKSWACKYKVKIPAGLSNCATSRSGLAFSEDNSLLAIAFDTIVTIWDTDGGRLLTTFDHSQGTTNLDSLRFVSPGVHQDLLLIQSSKCISLRSLYGANGSSGNFEGWSWSVHPSAKGSSITGVELIESHECVAISIYNQAKDQSKIVLVDVKTGKRASGTSLIENLEGSIRSLCAIGKPRVPKSNWDAQKQSNKSTQQSPLMLYALMSTGDLVLCTELSNYQGKTKTLANAEDFVSAAPRLDISTNNNDRRKRQRTNTTSSNIIDEELLFRPKRLALDVFGFGTNNDSTLGPSTAELPSLSSNFVRTFLGRNLQKSNA